MAIFQAFTVVFVHILNHENFPAFALTAVALLSAYWLLGRQDDLPEVNPRKPFEFTNRRRILEFIQNSKTILGEGRRRFKNQPYKLMSEWGSLVVLPPACADELRSDPRMDFSTPVEDDSHAYIPGFEPLQTDPHVNQVVTKYLTKALNKITTPLSEEASKAIQDVLTDNTVWHDVSPYAALLQIVARLSTRVFLGEAMCSDPEWIKASTEYTSMAFGLGDRLRSIPRSLRWISSWFLPSCYELRRTLAQCRKVLAPHIAQRKLLAAEAERRGEKIIFDDSIEWFEKEYGSEPHDPAIKQVTLSVVAIHTTTDLLLQTMSDIALHPELFEPLREEMIRVLTKEGLKKTSLQSLKLMDSVLKESQRLKPSLLGSFRRQATENIKLTNGYTISQGTRIVIDSSHMWSSAYYDDPETYDGYRFLKKRETPGEDKNTQLVSTSAAHMGFGHGVHACPGRFFAANEVKIALCHLLLKYDWRLPMGHLPQPMTHGMTYLTDPATKMVFRRRKEELNLEQL
ncbi:hypothetical protein NM208_g1575 [Fusarium decemcellulare]|uniref:Uncharacterized protein n=1 Tax=Fusarium decemcellulare TaxID=57161 RepID=A0ACC1SVQ1_9HYPO|nr:hypothetical protein NM208_g1575 [Fusarium decemcellulare]